jgi:outer membrane lipoprotein-sorting protein
VGETDVCAAYRVRFYGGEEVDLVLVLSNVRLDKKIPDAVFEYKVPPGAKVEDLDAVKESN